MMSGPFDPRRSAKSFAFAATLSAIIACAYACGPTSPACADSEIVVGVQAETALQGATRGLRIVASDDSGELGRIARVLPNNAPLFPSELPLVARGTRKLTITTEAFGSPVLDGAPLVSRTAILQPDCGQSKTLVRLALQDACLGVQCTIGQTCQAGSCVSAAFPLEGLESYSSSWAAESDACAPAGSSASAPEVILGTGQTDYVATPADSTVKVEAGPQGGHHIWIGVRTKGLHQRAATITLSAVVEGTNIVAPTQRTVFSLRTDEGGYCKLFGLRYQLDGEGPVSSFLGKPLRVAVEVRDSTGLTAKDDLRVMISDAAQGF